MEGESDDINQGGGEGTKEGEAIGIKEKRGPRYK
jgi:hypothetical protein